MNRATMKLHYAIRVRKTFTKAKIISLRQINAIRSMRQMIAGCEDLERSVSLQINRINSRTIQKTDSVFSMEVSERNIVI